MTKTSARYLFLLVLIISFSIEMNAQSVHFDYSDGTNNAYNLKDVRKATFNSDVMNLQFWDGTVYSWNVSTIKQFQYDQNTVNIAELLTNANTWNVNVFPNPTNDLLQVSFSLIEAEEITISIFDVQGKLIILKKSEFKRIGNTKETIDLSIVPDGTYICQIKGARNTITKIITKQ
jgi:hypothetical protein